MNPVNPEDPIVRQVAATRRPHCGRCHQDIRDFKQDYDFATTTITVSGTCGCGFQSFTIPDPRFHKVGRPHAS